MNKRRVVVTGLGLITPCGTGVERSWQALIHGESGVKPITLIDASMLQTRFAGEVRDFVAEDFMDRKQVRRLDRYQQFALAAAEMAMQDSGVVVNEHNAERAAVIVGSCVGGLANAEDATLAARPSSPGRVSPFFILNVLINMAASHISIRYGFKGPNWSTNSACATSAHALGEAFRLIQRGDADIALAGGAEAPIGFMCIAGFNAIRALSTRNDDPTRASRPFDAARDGFVLGEGAAILVLESLEHAEQRGARIHAELSGYGASSDAFHVTAPSPEHEGAQRCLRAALADAGIDVSCIDYINAHGTSTPLGDVAEITAIKRVFGEHAKRVPVSSTKSMTGHLTGAAGSAEAIISILAMQRGVIPPTINLDTIDPAIDVDCVPNVARPAICNTVMTNSFGFGGTNAALIFSRFE
ncbi:MAG: beta-ketoacyl-ACP synthase II [Gemmatimonas sp.]